MAGAASILLLLFSSSAFAQTTDGTVLLDVIEVTAPKEPPPPGSLQQRDPTAALTVVDANTRRTEVHDAADLVSASPGTLVQDSGGLGQRKVLSLRGSAPNGVGVWLDGIPLAGPGLAVDFSRVPLAIVDHLEVLRGGASGRFGLGTLGGVVNLVTRSPRGTHVFADAQFGSYFTLLGNAGAAAPLLGGDALLLAHGLTSRGNYPFRYDATPSLPDDPLISTERANNESAQGGALIKYRKHLGTTDLDVLGEWLSESRGLAGTVQNPTIDGAQATTRGLAAVRTSTRFSTGGEVSALVHARIDNTVLAGSPFGALPFKQLEASTGLEAVYSHLLAERHALSALASVAGDFLREPTAKNPAWARAALMLADAWRVLQWLLINGSVRVDFAGPFTVFSPRLGVALALPYGLEVKANGGQSARAPSFQELYVMQGTLIPNSGLRPERALSADVSLGWKNEHSAATATGFFALYEDLISYEYYPPTLARPYNFAAARIAGLELEATTHPFPWLEASAAYTFLNTANLRDDPRYYLKSLPFRPVHRVNARVVVGPWFLKGRVDVQAQSEQFQNRTETLSVPARALVNAGLSFKPTQNSPVTLGAEVKNLLDVQSQDIDGYPLPPRAAYVSLSFDLEVKPTVTP